MGEILDIIAREIIVSNPTVEAEDITIPVLSVALNTGQIKNGDHSRSDREAKYKQLL